MAIPWEDMEVLVLPLPCERLVFIYVLTSYGQFM
jgi:hypothetical protein